MNGIQLETLATLRSVVGYLGEQGQYAWWPSSFFSPSSNAFLNPVFPRVPNLARFTGVTYAASLVHDERIGIGRVFHLFRLPEDIEQWLHRVAQDKALWQKITPHLASKDVAFAYLHATAAAVVHAQGGPIRVGDIHGVRSSQSWPVLAALYLDAFEAGRPTYPYFSDPAL